MQSEFQRHGLDTVRRLPLFVAAPPKESIARAGEGPLVFLGRLAATKGVELMLDAVSTARRTLGEPLPLVLLGDGSLRGRVERAVARSREQCTLRGWVSTTERDRVLRSAHLLLVPSVWPEPFGLAGLEAGRFGVPAVAFGVGGIPEWLEDGVNGVLLDPRKLTAGAFGAGIVRALTLLRGGRNLRDGAREVASRFRIETHVDSLVSIFENASARGPSGSRV
jgi:glycosyltransferase involved in cell wall biosynthesis